MIIDEQATKEQRDALIAIESGQHGGLIWEVSAAVAPNPITPLFAPITFNVDREKRRATVRIPGIGETTLSRSKPCASAKLRHALCCPDGFEFKEAEWVTRVLPRRRRRTLAFELKNTYGN
jgi:hypothetical protein